MCAPGRPKRPGNPSPERHQTPQRQHSRRRALRSILPWPHLPFTLPEFWENYLLWQSGVRTHLQHQKILEATGLDWRSFALMQQAPSYALAGMLQDSGVGPLPQSRKRETPHRGGRCGEGGIKGASRFRPCGKGKGALQGRFELIEGPTQYQL